MPRRDGTGPMGRGSMTGRCMGVCRGYGYCGYPRGYRFGGYAYNPLPLEADKTILEDEKSALKARLYEIDKLLDKKN